MGKADHAPVLVTGAAGFIGSHVCGALIARGQRVAGIDNFDPLLYGDRNEALKRGNLDEVSRAPGAFEFERADICDAAAMRALFAKWKPLGVIHLAAKAGVRPSITDPGAYLRTNVVGTSNVLECAREGGCARVVAASSSSVYGNAPTVPFHEEMDVGRPISPYAASKRAAELVCAAHHHLHKTPVACLRFFTVFGPRQRPDLAIAKFLEMVWRGEAIPFFGDGSSSRDYTFIDDIVAGVLAAYDRIDKHGFRIWNLGGHRPHSLSELVATVERVVGRKATLDRRPMQAGDVERTFADLTRSGAELGFAPTTGLEEGIRRQWAWMREARPSPIANAAAAKGAL